MIVGSFNNNIGMSLLQYFNDDYKKIAGFIKDLCWFSDRFGDLLKNIIRVSVAATFYEGICFEILV